jgi:hypothetical protein
VDRVRRHLTRLLGARLLLLVGLAALVGGIAIEFGFGWALIVGGVLASLYGLLGVDIDEPKGARR